MKQYTRVKTCAHKDLDRYLNPVQEEEKTPAQPNIYFPIFHICFCCALIVAVALLYANKILFIGMKGLLCGIGASILLTLGIAYINLAIQKASANKGSKTGATPIGVEYSMKLLKCSPICFHEDGNLDYIIGEEVKTLKLPIDIFSAQKLWNLKPDQVCINFDNMMISYPYADTEEEYERLNHQFITAQGE